MVATILSICFLPWKLVENPESYVSILLNGTLAVFLGPITGICLAALWSQYRNRLRLPDLYYQDGGAYYYQGGWNVLAPGDHGVPVYFFIFVCQFIPVLRWIYDSSYLLGCVFAFVIYSALCSARTAEQLDFHIRHLIKGFLCVPSFKTAPLSATPAAFRADLLLEDGVVKAVGAELSVPDAQVIDASGK